ncbi:hypothetical protein [Halorientalis marina]|uniref:hypothetical protein n=1 Tax=Halorientalis marina TaxID=2931976 RepID=UPI001FF30096|nr:hypothetical protein [Halorientalis marina]
MADADGDAGVAATTPERAAWRPRRASVLAFVAFLVVIGQPAAVVALAVTSPSAAVLAVIVGGTALLAAPATRAYLGQGWSVSRLADFVLAVGLTQFGLVLLSSAFASGGLRPGLAQPALVAVSYPVVYLLLTRVVWAGASGT